MAEQAAKTIKEIQELYSRAGLDYNTVRAKGFDSYQLAEIQKGLEAGISVTDYLDPEMPWTEMEECRLELEQGIDLSSYRNQGYSTDRLSQIRQGMIAGLDVSVYARQASRAAVIACRLRLRPMKTSFCIRSP